MEELDQNYRIARWIVAEATGSITDEESACLMVWRKEDGAHERQYREIRNRLLEDAQAGERLDIRKEWKGFEKKLPVRKKVVKLWYYAGAACVVFGLVVTLLWKTPVVTDPVLVGMTGVTKGFKATLTLGDGRRINIGDSTDKTIAVVKGARIVSGNNQVVYDAVEEPRKEEVEWNTISVPRGGEYKLVLSDGTRVWLNSESQLTYPVRFTGDTREVKMQGEICFSVARDESQPFIVRSGEVAVKVLGTLFNMEAYAGERQVTTTLVSGKVEVQLGGQVQLLRPDQQLVIEDDRFFLKEVIAADYISWTNGLFHFTEASLEEIMTRLARWYEVEFFFAAPSLKDAHFSLDIRRYDHISSILSKLERTGRARFRVNGKTIIIEE